MTSGGARGLARRLRERFAHRGARTGLALRDDGSLVPVGASWQPERADSAVLAELAAAGVELDRPILVRHHLVLPDELAAEEAARLVSDEGYAAVVVASPDDEGVLVRLSRAEVPSGLTLAQQRSRMAGLAQRLGGDARGWDLLAPPEREADGDRAGTSARRREGDG